MIRREREELTIPPNGRSLDEQPKWRQDFPIDWPQAHYLSRRDFTKFMVLISLAFTAGQFWIVLKNFWRRRRGQPRRVVRHRTGGGRRRERALCVQRRL